MPTQTYRCIQRCMAQAAVMGPKEATGVFDRKTGACTREPKITVEMMQTAVKDAKVELRDAGVDESPFC